MLLAEDDTMIGRRCWPAPAGLTVDWVRDGAALNGRLPANLRCVPARPRLPQAGSRRAARTAVRRLAAAVVVLTARDAIADRRRLDAGADDYVVKPFDLAELAARIRCPRRKTGRAQPLLEHAGVDAGSRRSRCGAMAHPTCRLASSRCCMRCSTPGHILSRSQLRNASTVGARKSRATWSGARPYAAPQARRGPHPHRAAWVTASRQARRGLVAQQAAGVAARRRAGLAPWARGSAIATRSTRPMHSSTRTCARRHCCCAISPTDFRARLCRRNDYTSSCRCGRSTACGSTCRGRTRCCRA